MTDEQSRLAETLDAVPYEPPRRRRSAFAWLIVVLAALGSLGGCAVLLFSRRHKPNSIPMTKHLIYDARLACETYRLEYGRYPWPKPPAVTSVTVINGKDVYAELRALPGARINTKQDFLSGMRKGFVKKGALVDSWGRELQFRVNYHGLQAVIWSCGPNGIDETNDGDSPDPTKWPKSYYLFDKGDTGDDITEPSVPQSSREDDPTRSEKYGKYGAGGISDEQLILKWRSRKIDVAEVEAGKDFCKDSEQWNAFKTALKPEDEIWYFCSPGPLWEKLMGWEGYAIFREGKLLKTFTLREN